MVVKFAVRKKQTRAIVLTPGNLFVGHAQMFPKIRCVLNMGQNFLFSSVSSVAQLLFIFAEELTMFAMHVMRTFIMLKSYSKPTDFQNALQVVF